AVSRGRDVFWFPRPLFRIAEHGGASEADVGSISSPDPPHDVREWSEQDQPGQELLACGLGRGVGGGGGGEKASKTGIVLSTEEDEEECTAGRSYPPESTSSPKLFRRP